MKRAIVLSGGGSKGAYQLGFWKAIRKLGIDYQIVTGTSIGAINGAFMVQGNYNTAFRLWYFMNYKKIYELDIENSYYSEKGKKEVLLKYIKGAMKGGLNTPGLYKMVSENIDIDKFFSSKVDYGLVTVKVPSLKPALLTKDKMKKDKLYDYLMASSCCFPAFKVKEIENESYIDGGYYDGLPINLALEMGADEIIAVELRSFGVNRKVENKNNVPITIIEPKNNLGNFLVMEEMQIRRDIKLGYNDTMKKFNRLEGEMYTFKKGSLKRNYNRLNVEFYKNFDFYIDKDLLKKIKFKKFKGIQKEEAFNEILENLAYIYLLDDTKVYRTSIANVLIKKSYNNDKYNNYKNIKNKIKNNKLKSSFLTKELVEYIYYLMKKNRKFTLKRLATLFPDAFLCAIYLKTLLKEEF